MPGFGTGTKMKLNATLDIKIANVQTLINKQSYTDSIQLERSLIFTEMTTNTPKSTFRVREPS